MNNHFINEIYKYFDLNGIQGYHASQIRLDFELSNLHGEGDLSNMLDQVSCKKNEPELVFVPDLSEFGLNKHDAENVILSYVFDTTGLKIKSLINLSNLHVRNGFPFF